MPKHITSVLEFREAGIKLKTRRNHVIRVLGALKEVPLPDQPITWESIGARGDNSIHQQYDSGALAGPQDDHEAQAWHPQVPTLFITRKGEVLFLQRDWS
ncbi:MAG: hypothetical protein JNM66_09310 [Bryobacterales bacterium]|nr:hypothetical protein [Bryobacterales bacterium]